MQEQPGFREVYVQVDTNLTVGNFGGGTAKPTAYVVRVRLSDDVLRLEGEPFIAAVREALERVLIGNGEVHIEKDLVADRDPVDPECTGYNVPIETLKPRDSWYEAEPQEKT